MRSIRLLMPSILMITFLIISGCSQDTLENNDTLEDSITVDSDNPMEIAEKDPEIIKKLSKVTDTNQDKCYDEVNQIVCPRDGEEYFGQDSQYQTNPTKYQDNRDGTITDLNTGLMWVKDAGEKIGYYDARMSISFAGYSDWRIPSIKELYSLMDFRGIDPDAASTSSHGLVPFIDTDYFVFEYGDVSIGDRIIDSQWITTSIYKGKVMKNEECFFGVNFADGRIKCYPTRNDGNNGYFLRYVRGEEYGINSFIDNNDTTITDQSTGLMWQKYDSQKALDWKDALKYCENLQLLGHDDWRLPDAKELEYLVDYERSPDQTDSPAIDPIFETTQINNELGQKDYPYFWTSTTHLNHNDARSAVYISFGRGIGQMNGNWMDVHGAGCQRSDPKIGKRDDYPQSHGPQGDARRVYNYARCVRGNADILDVDSENIVLEDPSSAQSSDDRPMPPQEAIDACQSEGDSCSFSTPKETVNGICKKIDQVVACVPK